MATRTNMLWLCLAFALRSVRAQQCMDTHACPLCHFGPNSDSSCCDLMLNTSVYRMRHVTVTTDPVTGACLTCNAQCLTLTDYQAHDADATQQDINAFCKKCGGAAEGELTRREVDYVIFNGPTVSLLSQRIAKEFLLIVMGVDVPNNEELVRVHLDELEAVIGELVNKTTWMTGSMFGTDMENLLNYFDTFKSSIANSNMFPMVTTTTATTTYTTQRTSTTVTTMTTTLSSYAILDIITAVSDASNRILSNSRIFTEKFRDYSGAMGFEYLILREFVNRKRILSQELPKAAVMRGLGRSMPESYNNPLAVAALTQLLKAMDNFDQTHFSLLRGESWLRHEGVSVKCALQQTMQVTYYYEEMFVPHLRKVIYRLNMDIQAWHDLDTESNRLFSWVESNIPLLDILDTGVHPTCNIHEEVSSYGASWRKALKQVGEENRIVQEMNRIYFQIAKNFDRSARIDRLQIRLDFFLTGLSKLIEGNRVDQIPPPPTQSLAYKLYNLFKDSWPPLGEILMQAVQGKTAMGGWDGADNSTLLLAEARGNELNALFEDISLEYAGECPTAANCFLLDTVGGQAVSYEKLVKQVWLVSLFPNSTNFLQELNWTMYNLSTTTLSLVRGVRGNSDLPRTRNVCILQELRQVRTKEASLIEHTEDVVFSGNFSMMKLEQVTRDYFATGNLKDTFDRALSLYSQDNPTCDYLNSNSASQWREGLAAAARLAGLVPQIVTEFLLVEKLRDLASPDVSEQGEQYNHTLVATSIPFVDLQIEIITLGALDEVIPSAPMQQIDDAVFTAQDKWFNMADMVTGVFHLAQLEQLTNYAYGLALEFRAVLEEYVTYARRCSIDINQISPTTISLTEKPLTAIQTMGMEALLLAMWEGSNVNLTRSMTDFERSLAELDVEAAGVYCRIRSITLVRTTWGDLKPRLQAFIDTATYTKEQLTDMVEKQGTMYQEAIDMQKTFTDATGGTCPQEARARGASPHVIVVLGLLFAVMQCVALVG